MLFSEATGRKVVSTSTAETLGQVAAFVVDPQTHSVVALTLKKTEGSGDTVLWGDLKALGSDAVTVSGGDVISAADDAVAALSDKTQRLLGKRILTTAGRDLGAVTDVDFDSTTGEITALMLANDTVAGSRLIGIGSYAAVVHAES